MANQRKKIQSLMIEDDPFCVAVLKHYGDEMTKYELIFHHTIALEDSLKYLDEHPEVEIVFLDYRVDSVMTGLEILQHIRAKGIRIPVIVLTGSGNEEVAVAMMKAGASDYFTKGTFNSQKLEKAIEYALDRYHSFSLSEQGRLQDQSIKDIAIGSTLSGVCLIDVNGMINYVNPAFLSMWNIENENIVLGKPFKDCLMLPEQFQEIQEALTVRRSWMGEIAVKKSGGGNFVVKGLFSIIKSNTGSQQIMSSFIDVTGVKEAEKRQESLYRAIVEVFALRAEESGNVETAGHIRRISAYTELLAKKLRGVKDFSDIINEKYIKDLSYASMLHDVGKWRMPAEVLLKPGALTKSEWDIIRQHPRLGIEMLEPLLKDKGNDQYLKFVESVVLYHHERWDGSGYPGGLKGENIPLSARIVALADVYEALTSNRAYRGALTHEEAFEEMVKEKEKFDPRIWKVFEDNQDDFKKIKNKIM
jgi:PAS domain S-box-containing protein